MPGLGLSLSSLYTLGGVSKAAYLGPVASGVRLADGFNTGNKMFMAESSHVAADDITSITVGFANWSMSGSGVTTSAHVETLLGASATRTGSVVYNGTFNQLIFPNGGSPSATSVGADGSTVFGTVAVTIPKGAVFTVRQWFSSTGGIPYIDQFFAPGSPTTLMNFGASGIADQTMGGTITNVSNVGQAPCAILGMTKKGTVTIYGTSRSYGEGDSRPTAAEEVGTIARSLLAAGIGFTNVSLCADRIDHFLAGPNTRRLALGAFSSHKIIEYGVNDFSASVGNRSAAAVEADIQTLIALDGGKPTYVPTIEPLGTGETAGNAIRVTHNTNVRAGLANVKGYFEIADLLETARNSSVWNASYTADNLHANSTGTKFVAASGVINAAQFS